MGISWRAEPPRISSLPRFIHIPNPEAAKYKKHVHYNAKEMGVDYTKGKLWDVSESHKLLATEEEYSKWCRKH